MNIRLVKQVYDAILGNDGTSTNSWDIIRQTRNVILAHARLSSTQPTPDDIKANIRAALLADVDADIESVYNKAEIPPGDNLDDVDFKVPTPTASDPESFCNWLKRTLGCVVHPSHLLVKRTQTSLYAKLAFAFNETYRHHVRMSRYVYAKVDQGAGAHDILEQLLRQCPEVSCVRIVCIQTDAGSDVQQYVVPNPDFMHLHTDVSLKARLNKPLRATDAEAIIDVGTEHHFPTEGVAYFRIRLDADIKIAAAKTASDTAVDNIRGTATSTSLPFTDPREFVNNLRGLVQNKINSTTTGPEDRLAVETAVRELEKRAERAYSDGKSVAQIKTSIRAPSSGIDHPKVAGKAALGPEYIYAELAAHDSHSSMRVLKIKSRGVGQTFIPESRPSTVSTVEVSTFFSPIEIVLVLDRETGALLPTRPHQR